MKKYIFLFFLPVCIISCGNKADQPITDDDSIDVTENRFMWQATLNDSTGKLEMKHIKSEDSEPLSVQSVIESSNQIYPEIILAFVRISNDTVYLKIDDADFLTQQMGSSGPMTYLAGLVYNLTEIPTINYVHLDFEEGDHASPGTFTRDTFKDE